MLQHLHIENMAVIEQADIGFDRGLNVLTGETGAGKSVVIAALGMVLGERSSREMVRTGCEKTEVTALFSDLSEAARQAVAGMGYETPNGQLLLRRYITGDGRSLAYINGSPVTVTLLRSVGQLLVNVHGQHDNQALMAEEKQRGYLDALGGLQPLLDTYLEAYHRYGKIARRLKKLRMDEQEKAQRMDTLRFQIDEIEKFAPQIGEEQELTERRSRMRHAEKIASCLGQAGWAMEGDEQSMGALAAVQAAATALEEVSEYLPSMQPASARLQEIRYELEEMAADIEQTARQLQFDEQEKEEVENRLSALRRLLAKYGPTEENMLEHLDSIHKEWESMEGRDQLIAQEEQLLEQAEQDTVEAAKQLTQARRETADRFVQRVMEQLEFLDMPGTVMEISMEPTTMTASGGDRVAFLLAANAGEAPKPLARAASGGELSRIMLAIKSVMAKVDDIDTLVFDEIDAGISGHAARKVGIKLKETAASRQVLCITHLAQIAAMADRHFLVSKQVQGERTYSHVDIIDGPERERELSRIISGEVTPAGMQAARDLLIRTREDAEQAAARTKDDKNS